MVSKVIWIINAVKALLLLLNCLRKSFYNLIISSIIIFKNRIRWYVSIFLRMHGLIDICQTPRARAETRSWLYFYYSCRKLGMAKVPSMLDKHTLVGGESCYYRCLLLMLPSDSSSDPAELGHIASITNKFQTHVFYYKLVYGTKQISITSGDQRSTT